MTSSKHDVIPLHHCPVYTPITSGQGISCFRCAGGKSGKTSHQLYRRFVVILMCALTHILTLPPKHTHDPRSPSGLPERTAARSDAQPADGGCGRRGYPGESRWSLAERILSSAEEEEEEEAACRLSAEGREGNSPALLPASDWMRDAQGGERRAAPRRLV